MTLTHILSLPACVLEGALEVRSAQMGGPASQVMSCNCACKAPDRQIGGLARTSCVRHVHVRRADGRPRGRARRGAHVHHAVLRERHEDPRAAAHAEDLSKGTGADLSSYSGREPAS